MSATKKNPKEKVAKPVEDTVAKAKKAVEQVVKSGTEAFGVYEEAVSYGKDNMDAVMNANSVFSKGIQAINLEVFAMVQATLEANAAATQKMFTCSSVQDVVSTQNELIQESYSKAFDQAQKVSGMTVKVSEDAAAPLTQRVNVAVETISKKIAA